jgi:PAS domain S-box-containing protein
MTRKEFKRADSSTVADVAIIMMDNNGGIQRWNAGAERILGWSEAEVLGRSADILFTPEDIDRDQPSTERHDALVEGLAASARWYVRNDGSRLWASSETYPVADQHATQIGFLKVVRDRTRDRLEAEVTLSMKERSVSALGLGMVITDA